MADIVAEVRKSGDPENLAKVDLWTSRKNPKPPMLAEPTESTSIASAK
jgi:hypothetical protein